MKSIFLLAVMMGMLSLGQAQTFTTLPNNSMGVALDPRHAGEYYFYFENISQQPLTLAWTELSATFPVGWVVQVCDNGSCHNVPYPGDTMVTFAQADSGFLKLTVVPMELPGIGYFCYEVRDTVTGYTNNVCLSVNASGTSVQPASLASRVSVQPTPATDVVHLIAKTGSLDKGLARIYDLSGNLVMTQEVSATRRNDLVVKDLKAGIYLLRYESKAGAMTQKVVIAR